MRLRPEPVVFAIICLAGAGCGTGEPSAATSTGTNPARTTGAGHPHGSSGIDEDVGPAAEAAATFEQSPAECFGQPVPTTNVGVSASADDGGRLPRTDDPLVTPMTFLERRLRQDWGFENRTVEELIADVDTARASLAEYQVRLTASELAEMRAREQLTEPASNLFEHASALSGFGGFFFDSLEGEYVLRVVGPTKEANELSTMLPQDRIRIERADFTIEELESVADQIVPFGDDGFVDAAMINEPYRSLVAAESISVGIIHSANRVHVWVTSDVPCAVVRTIAATGGDRIEILAMGEASDD